MRSRFFIVIFFVMALVSRSLIAFISRDFFQGDAMYLLLARNIAEGKPHLDYGGWGNGYWFQPGYSAVSALLNLFVHDFIFSSQVISIIAGSMVVFPLFYLARKLFGPRVGYISLGLFIVYPALAISSVSVLPGPFFTFLLITSIYLGSIAIEGKKRYSFLAGITIGFSFLVRETALLMGAVLGLWIGISALRARDRKALLSPLLFILGVVMVIFPWLVYLRIETGEWVLVPKTGYNLCLYYRFKGAVLNKQATGFVITEESKDISLARLFIENPSQVIRHFLVNTWKLYRHILPHLLPLLPMGLFFLGISDFRDIRKSLYMFSFFFPFLVLYPLVAVYNNYFIPLLPLSIIWMSRGIEILTSFLKRGAGLCFYFVIFLMLFLSFSADIKFEISKMRRVDNGWSRANKEVGIWIREHKEKKRPRILSRKPEPVFFAGGEYVFLPQENLERVLKFAHFLSADYIILDKAFSVIYPDLKSLFTHIPSSIKLLYRYTDNNQDFLVLSP